jgi:integrase/recombinase XerD
VSFHFSDIGQGITSDFPPHLSENYSQADHNARAVWQTFIGLARRAGIRNDNDASRPCIHGVGHSFAVGRLLDWYRRGLSVNDLLPTLSVYMGHVQPANTYWYLTATPELLNVAGEYFQKFAGRGVEQ